MVRVTLQCYIDGYILKVGIQDHVGTEVQYVRAQGDHFLDCIPDLAANICTVQTYPSLLT